MTKEDLLRDHDKYAWECDESEHVVPYSEAEKAMDEYAKQQAIAFSNYVMIDYKASLHSGSPILSDEEIYNQFIEQQNKEK